MRSALVVGGQDRFIQTRIVPRLAEHGIEVVDSWPVDKEPGEHLPKVDLLYFVTDMMSHRHNDTAKAMAQKANIPIVMALQKWAVTRQRLIDAGFPALNDTLASTVTEETLLTYYTETSLPQSEYAEARIYTKATLPSGFYRGAVVRTREFYDEAEPRTAWLVELKEGPATVLQSKVCFLELQYTPRDVTTLLTIMKHGKVTVPPDFQTNDSIPIEDLPLYMQHLNGKITYMSETQWQMKSARQRRHAQQAPAPSAAPLPPPPLPALPPEPDEDAMSYQPAYECISDYRDAAPGIKTQATIALPLLAAEPFRTLDSFAGHLNISSGQVQTGIALARKMLHLKGLKYFASASQYETFASRCRMFGCTPVSMEAANASPYAKAPPALVAPAPAPASTPTPAEDTMPAPVAPLTPAPVSAPPSAPSDDLGEFKTMLAMLREEMKRVGVESVTLGPKGANFRRVVVIEDTVDV